MWKLRKGQPRLWHIQGQRRDGGRDRERDTWGKGERESNGPGYRVGGRDIGTERGKGRDREGQRERLQGGKVRGNQEGEETHTNAGTCTHTHTHPQHTPTAHTTQRHMHTHKQTPPSKHTSTHRYTPKDWSINTLTDTHTHKHTSHYTIHFFQTIIETRTIY